MGVLIDVSVLLEHARGRLDLDSRVEGRSEESFYLSVLSAGQLLLGAEQGTARARAQRSAFTEAVLQRFPLLPLDLGAARAHARLGAEMRDAGAGVGATDLWLAAQALAHGLVLAVGEPRELARVPGLRLESWLVRSP